MNKYTSSLGFLVSFLAGGSLAWGLGHGDAGVAVKEELAAKPGARASGAPLAKVELYVMSQCPYGVQAEKLFADVVKRFGSDLDFRVEFIGQKSATGELTSMHGPNEVKGDLVQSCAMKHAPESWFELVSCQNEDYKDVATNWRSCSDKLGLPTARIAQCAEGAEGAELLSASFDRAKDEGANGSPTILINGTKYAGARRSTDIMRAICDSASGPKPAACADLPEAPSVAVTVLTDSRCTTCDTKRLEAQLRQKVANPVFTTVDYQTPAGKQLFGSIQPTSLPALVFDASLDRDVDAKNALARGLRQAGALRVSESGSFNPVCADDGGCAKAECKLTSQCREQAPESEKKLELFVMSQCPYGIRGLDALREVITSFSAHDQSLDLSVHYIPQGDPSALQSMHGPAEVAEDLRAVCAIEHYPAKLKYLDYIWCRNKNIKDPNWQSCTGGDTGIDTAVIDACQSGPEGKRLLVESFTYAKNSGVGASPTWIANGKFKFSGIDAETVKTNVCAHNDLGPACQVELSGPPPRVGGPSAAAAPGCGG